MYPHFLWHPPANRYVMGWNDGTELRIYVSGADPIIAIELIASVQRTAPDRPRAPAGVSPAESRTV
ncbi:MAG: hypothetical protein ABSH46_11535 [Bryobacteraceae bacterium]|jgi:hypothetical protein